MSSKRLIHYGRVVVKIGTSSLIHPKTGKVNLLTIDRLAYTLSALNNQGVQVLLVSSGAIGVGLDRMHMQKRPAAIAEQQALAAIGQLELMNLYSQRFSDYGTQIGQLLLTHDTFDYPVSRQHVFDTIDALLAKNVIPVINENDSVATDEMDHHTTFGDNDQLAAIVATQVGADTLIVLSDIDGLYDRDPNKFSNAHLMTEVEHLSDKVLMGAGGSSTRFGTGGMVTKLRAAERMINSGGQMVLASGADPRVILRILAGERIGTWFGENVLEAVISGN
ncbi:glutamate 5-kinase [Lacticaseibacillus hulanensis]|uniref:glutamate 5-kinase n=1 Tax=Lacticaseibacillus hulanensis TaxID=2493111 RepID=UPI000FDCBF27|nr:glutamate 5-kinase [Lacticaseibacillus hulanensis]